MARIKKKGSSGAAKRYLTRSQAMARLQVSLADFRRLCIFKGIYPREPLNKKKVTRGSTAPTTFYFAKDIKYLMHEPVLAKFREHKTFSKKLQRALGRNELGEADRLDKNRPRYKLDHLVRERYPTFLDALRDLDDPLNMLFLFANMPAVNTVSSRVTKDAAKLSNQWLAYVAKERLIKKVFVSIKGVYYLATVKGQEIRWLVPFKFPTNIPSDVDLRVMLNFLEFYSTMVHFVLFKLYSDADLVYPPPIDTQKLKGIGGLASYVMQSRGDALVPQEEPEKAATPKATQELSTEELQKAKDADAADVDDEPETVNTVELDEFAATNKTPGDLLSQPSKYASSTSTLFSGFVFFVGREVPLDILELCILSGGGQIVSEIAIDELKLNLPQAYKNLDMSKITHQLVDRPKIKKVAGRTYIQPQWIFDSINKAELLPVGAYAPGETLPPHLSPWGDAGNYNPEAPVSENDESSDEEAADDAAEEEVDEDLKEQKELEMEAQGVQYSEVKEPAKKKKAKKATKSVEEEEKEMRAIMMTNKQRKLYGIMKQTNEKKDNRVEKLAKKRKQIEKVKKAMK